MCLLAGEAQSLISVLSSIPSMAGGGSHTMDVLYIDLSVTMPTKGSPLFLMLPDPAESYVQVVCYEHSVYIHIFIYSVLTVYFSTGFSGLVWSRRRNSTPHSYLALLPAKQLLLQKF